MSHQTHVSTVSVTKSTTKGIKGNMTDKASVTGTEQNYDTTENKTCVQLKDSARNLESRKSRHEPAGKSKRPNKKKKSISF